MAGKGCLASLAGDKNNEPDNEATLMRITSRGATGNMARIITGPDAIETTTTAIMSRGVTVSIEELCGGSAAYGLWGQRRSGFGRPQTLAAANLPRRRFLTGGQAITRKGVFSRPYRQLLIRSSDRRPTSPSQNLGARTETTRPSPIAF